MAYLLHRKQQSKGKCKSLSLVTRAQIMNQMFKCNPQEFLCLYVTIDETWVQHSTPETNEQSKQWIEAGGSTSKWPKTQQSAGKVMATVFWNMYGMIHINYLEKGKKITA